MKQELELGIGARYSICLLLFFPGYTIFELPSNMALVRFGVKWTMTFLIVAWGLLIIGMGLVNHWVRVVL
jgi:MFS transporter, ACS family, DAL5 transporter family protein